MYQFQLPAVPRLPPALPRVVELPKHIGVVPVAEVAGVDKVLTVIVVFTHVVVLQVPAASK